MHNETSSEAQNFHMTELFFLQICLALQPPPSPFYNPSDMLLECISLVFFKKNKQVQKEKEMKPCWAEGFR